VLDGAELGDSVGQSGPNSVVSGTSKAPVDGVVIEIPSYMMKYDPSPEEQQIPSKFTSAIVKL